MFVCLFVYLFIYLFILDDIEGILEEIESFIEQKMKNDGYADMIPGVRKAISVMVQFLLFSLIVEFLKISYFFF